MIVLLIVHSSTVMIILLSLYGFYLSHTLRHFRMKYFGIKYWKESGLTLVTLDVATRNNDLSFWYKDCLAGRTNIQGNGCLS